MTEPLSVVVGLISGRPADLQRCLRALHTQADHAVTEIIVPYDDPSADVVRLADEFPAVRFIHADHLDTAESRRGASREHHDALRTLGLRAARGATIALTEDHAHVANTWCSEMIAALERHPEAAAVGGAVECDSRSLLNWAVWFCDFGRYQNPLPEAPAAFISDSNVVYRRTPLERVGSAWEADYHETAVHAAMVNAGYQIWTTPHAVVWQARSNLTFATALRERYVWGRSYAGTRAQLVSLAKRVVFALLTPALPFVLTWRVFNTTRRRGKHVPRLLRALPFVLLLQTVWAVGELVGYVTGKPT